MNLTVGDLLAQPGLEALALRAGGQHLHQAVRWYYVAENEVIADWVMGGELVFATQVVGTARVQRDMRLRCSQRDILTQLLTGDYPSTEITRQRASNLDLALNRAHRVIRLRLIEHRSGHHISDPQCRLNLSVALLIWRMSHAQQQELL